MTPQQILRVLHDARKNAGLSYQQLSDKTGVPGVTIRSHETGERQLHLDQLVEHASWFGLEVLLLPAGDGGQYQRGYDQAVTQVAELFGLPIDAAAMRNAGKPRAVDWDKVLDDAYNEADDAAD